KPDDAGNWLGVAFGRILKIGVADNNIVLYNTSEEDYLSIWKSYFDIDRNYMEIINNISRNDVLKTASSCASGIRILKQEPWEALCSFIISQNNNIPRIKGIIDRLCENFGDNLGGGFSFPTAVGLSNCTIEDLAPLRSGFRARYILDAAQKVANGDIDFELCKNGDIAEAQKELMKICGVGQKVADCSLLFGFGRIEAFPKDVWIKRAMTTLFDGELPECAVQYAGIVQQYIFHYARTTKLEI
ncbi:MAG: DNA glycosylase, partial [Oscillospiraceae bacterium]